MIDIAQFVRPGDGVWWGQEGAEATPLVDALLDRADELGPLTAFTGVALNPRVTTQLPGSVKMTSYGALGGLRRLARSGRLDVIPCHYSALPRMFARGLLPRDVGLVQVSPPDDDGMVSLGIGVDYSADAIRHTRTVLAEVNHRMPVTRGGPRFPLSFFDAVVETDRPLLEGGVREPDEVDRRIAAHVAGRIEDGDTIQVGVGALPDAVLRALSGHRNLGIHSGIITDAVLSLVESGVVDGSHKDIDTGLVITGSAFCTAAGHALMPGLPIEFKPTSYTHSPVTLSHLKDLVSVNSAIEVDLSGQVGAEFARGTYLGAVGGQVDFSRAASLTGAQSIIALRSTVPSQDGGRDSTIVPALSGTVTTSRVDVDVVVTEHGVAELTGLTGVQRARRLIRVAAPEHREALERGVRESVH